MTKVSKNVLINAPVEKVFEYVSEPQNLIEWNPSITNVQDITGRGEGQQWTWSYKMMGLPVTGKAQVVSSVMNTNRRVKSTGGIQSLWSWRFQREAEGTRMEMEIDYTVPVPVLGKVGELLIAQRNERVAEMALANIKEKMES